MGQALSHCGLPQVSRGTLVVFAHGDPPTAPVLSGQTGLLRVTRVNGQGVFPGEWLHRLLLDERCHRQRMDRECNALELPLGYPRRHLRSACETNAGAVMSGSRRKPDGVGGVMRALSKLVTVAMVTVAFVRAGCTSSTVPPTTTTTSSRQTVIHADVAQFGTLARQELRKSFEAIYRFLYPKGVGKASFKTSASGRAPRASSPTRPP